MAQIENAVAAVEWIGGYGSEKFAEWMGGDGSENVAAAVGSVAMARGKFRRLPFVAVAVLAGSLGSHRRASQCTGALGVVRVGVVAGRSFGSVARSASRRASGGTSRSACRREVTNRKFDRSWWCKLCFHLLFFFHDLNRLPQVTIKITHVVH